MIKSNLEAVESALTKHGFACQLAEQTNEIPYHRVNVSFGKDDKGRERVAVIRADSFPMTPDPLGHESALGEQVFLHVFVAFPFLMKPEAAGELSRLLMYFNKPLEMPGFGVDEINKIVFYRYSLVCVGGIIKRRPLVAMIGTIMLLVDSLTSQIEAVASGAPIGEVLRSTVETLTRRAA